MALCLELHSVSEQTHSLQPSSYLKSPTSDISVKRIIAFFLFSSPLYNYLKPPVENVNLFSVFLKRESLASLRAFETKATIKRSLNETICIAIAAQCWHIC